MLATGSLWATHFQQLNDTSEVHGIQSQLVREWSKSFETILRTKRRIGKVDRAIISAGGLKPYAHILAQSLFDVLADVTFGTASRPATETVSGSPFILSFCSHVGQNYEAANGLLSQWRGYGGREGIAIVFDTEQLFRNLSAEYHAFAFSHLGFYDAIYAGDDVRLDEHFPRLFDAVDIHLRIKLGFKVPDPGAETISQFLAAATRFKHRAFAEEREVRIVACPVDERFFATSFGRPSPTLPLKPTFVAADKQRISLFGGMQQPLPIKRVIVGPSRGMEDVARRAIQATKGDVEIVLSATPFVEG